eukprot:1844557-Karenia_brevis.AAC.1
MIAIARQNGNHFVPLLENINAAGSGAGQQRNADVHSLDFDGAVKSDEQMAPEAMSDDQSSLFGDSTESLESMSSCSHRDSTDTEEELIEESVVEEPPPDAIFGYHLLRPKTFWIHFPESSDEEDAPDKSEEDACDHGDASSVAESVGHGSDFSDISDNSDVCHVEAAHSQLLRTDEDAII